MGGKQGTLITSGHVTDRSQDLTGLRVEDRCAGRCRRGGLSGLERREQVGRTARRSIRGSDIRFAPSQACQVGLHSADRLQLKVIIQAGQDHQPAPLHALRTKTCIQLAEDDVDECRGDPLRTPAPDHSQRGRQSDRLRSLLAG